MRPVFAALLTGFAFVGGLATSASGQALPSDCTGSCQAGVCHGGLNTGLACRADSDCPPGPFDHIKCYRIHAKPLISGLLDLTPLQTQLPKESNCKVKGPTYFCGPVCKDNVQVQPPPLGFRPGPQEGDHLCYAIHCPKPLPQPLMAEDQFGTFTFSFAKASLVCTPAIKLPTTTTTTTTTTSTTTTTCPQGMVTAGDVDDYVGPEPTSASPALQTQAANTCSQGSKGFDDLTTNRCVVQTFQVPCCVSTVTLTFVAKPAGGDPTNDDLVLYIENPNLTPIFSSRISALGGAGGSWNTNPSTTFVLGISGLNFMSQSDACNFDVLIEDDTAVDYMTLSYP